MSKKIKLKDQHYYKFAGIGFQILGVITAYYAGLDKDPSGIFSAFCFLLLGNWMRNKDE